jgi:hypothetical protein
MIKVVKLMEEEKKKGQSSLLDLRKYMLKE